MIHPLPIQGLRKGLYSHRSNDGCRGQKDASENCKSLWILMILTRTLKRMPTLSEAVTQLATKPGLAQTTDELHRYPPPIRFKRSLRLSFVIPSQRMANKN